MHECYSIKQHKSQVYPFAQKRGLCFVQKRAWERGVCFTARENTFFHVHTWCFVVLFQACLPLSQKRLRNTCTLFGHSFYIFLQLSVNSIKPIKPIRNVFGNNTCLRVLVLPTPLKQKHACSCLEKAYAAHAFYLDTVSISSCNSAWT
jgi:hypothetical protein